MREADEQITYSILSEDGLDFCVCVYASSLSFPLFKGRERDEVTFLEFTNGRKGGKRSGDTMKEKKS